MTQKQAQKAPEDIFKIYRDQRTIKVLRKKKVKRKVRRKKK